MAFADYVQAVRSYPEFRVGQKQATLSAGRASTAIDTVEASAFPKRSGTGSDHDDDLIEFAL